MLPPERWGEVGPYWECMANSVRRKNLAYFRQEVAMRKKKSEPRYEVLARFQEKV
ncbi:hypothetical protein HOV93_01350 [Planctomycetes bacterium FF15]|uniref:Uncharacterized protein n=1 Tax=Bremerella alba TaxID=980252 RepID=A0A7V8V1K7_9BACT|nr:hypothetical protein [Bremerella alba]